MTPITSIEHGKGWRSRVLIILNMKDLLATRSMGIRTGLRITRRICTATSGGPWAFWRNRFRRCEAIPCTTCAIFGTAAARHFVWKMRASRCGAWRRAGSFHVNWCTITPYPWNPTPSSLRGISRKRLIWTIPSSNSLAAPRWLKKIILWWSDYMIYTYRVPNT